MKPAITATPAVATIALVVATVLWSSSFIALKFSFQSFDSFVVIFGRMLVASGCFVVIFSVKKELFRFKNYEKGDWKLLFFMAFCEPCLYFFFEAQAIENTTASQAGVITATLPILVILAASLFLGEKTSKKIWAGALLALAGVCWLTLDNSATETAPHPVLGNFLEFLAMVCATGYTIAMKKLTVRYSPLLLTAIQAFSGCFFFFWLLLLPGVKLPVSFTPEATLAVIYLGSVITLGAYGLFNYSLKYVPASRAGACVNLIPVCTVLLGWMLLGERLSSSQIFAIVVILTGVYLTQKK